MAVTLPLWVSSAFTQTEDSPVVPPETIEIAQAKKPATSGAQKTRTSSAQKPDAQSSANISGTVIDQTGAVAEGAQVRLTRDDHSPAQEVASGGNGEYSFTNLPPGPFRITVTAPGFDTQTFSGDLEKGQAFPVPAIMLSITTAVTEVRVGVSPVEVAQEQIKEQEQQRVLGFIPNFFVSYVPDAAPLIPRQKFQLSWRSTIDPFTFVAVGMLAGLEQASDDFPGYGQGAEGYAKRYGAAYADVFAGTFIGSAILPSLLKQDPRYFYRGTGSTSSRLMYALGNSVICKGDNKKWQPNYSGILGSFATGGISYLYYPSSDRSTSLFLQNSLIRIAESSIAGVFQEFVLKKLTPHVQNRPADSHPSSTQP